MDEMEYTRMEDEFVPTIITPVAHRQHQLFHVLFRNGYENIFFTDAETGHWLEEDLGETHLAAAMCRWFEPLHAVKVPRLRQISWCRLRIAAMDLRFGYRRRVENGRPVYEVYSDNRKFLCNLRRNKKGEWIIYGSARAEMEWQYLNRLQVITRILEE